MQCARSTTTWASSRTRNPYCVILWASLLFDSGFCGFFHIGDAGWAFWIFTEFHPFFTPFHMLFASSITSTPFCDSTPFMAVRILHDV